MCELRGHCIKTLVFVLAMVIAPSYGIESRSVNLALETSFLFDPKDMKQNATFINKVQNVLNKLKTVLDQSAPVYRQNENVATPSFEAEKTTFTKFLSQVGSQLIHFDDDEIKLFAEDLKYAINKLVKKEEFKEICEDERLAAFILNSAEIWSKTEPIVLKFEIAKFIIKVDTDAVIQLFKVINRVFDTADEPKFKKLAKKFSKSVKQSDYKKFLYKTIDFVVFKRYKKLDFFFRHVITAEIRKFTDYVVKNYKERTVIKDMNTRRFRIDNIDSDDEIQKINNEKDNSSTEQMKSQKNPTLDSDKWLKNKNITETKDKDNNQKVAKEIVIDKDLNMDVRNNANQISLKIN